MSLNADALQFLVEKGLSAQDIVDFARLSERRADPTARDRKRRQRERDRDMSQRDVTRDTPLIEDNHIPPSSSQPSASKKARAQSFPPPEGVSDEQWANLMACRKAKRAAMTDGAYFQICRKLKEGADVGWPPGELVDRAVESGWTTVFIPKESPNGRMVGNLRQGGGGREHSAAKLLRDLEVETEREAQGCH